MSRENIIHCEIPFEIRLESFRSPGDEIGLAATIRELLVVIWDRRVEMPMPAPIGFLSLRVFDPSGPISILSQAEASGDFDIFPIAAAFYSVAPDNEATLSEEAVAAGARMGLANPPPLVFLEIASIERGFEDAGIIEAACALACRSAFLSWETLGNPPMLAAREKRTLFLCDNADAAIQIWRENREDADAWLPIPMPATMKAVLGLSTIGGPFDDRILGAGSIPMASIRPALQGNSFFEPEAIKRRALALITRNQKQQALALSRQADFFARNSLSAMKPEDLDALVRIGAEAGKALLSLGGEGQSLDATDPASSTHPAKG